MSYQQADEARRFLEARLAQAPAVGVVLGSGLGGFSAALADAVTVPYGEIPHWPRSSVAGHAGNLAAGRLGSTAVAVLNGRAHVYEGYAPAQVVFPVRVLRLLGIRTLVLTNACGGLNPAYRAGQLVLIADHMNLQGVNPLIGENDERFGTRFPDVSDVYPGRLRKLARECGRDLGLELAEGVYIAVSGPNYETPAEVRYLRSIGGDLVGMSTVPEALAAAHMGIPVLGISCVSDMAAGMIPEKITHEMVLAATARVAPTLVSLLQKVVPRL